MPSQSRPTPRGALEEAVSLCDELRSVIEYWDVPPHLKDRLADLERRRAALEPRRRRAAARRPSREDQKEPKP